MNYEDFQILVYEDHRIRVSSSQGEVSAKLYLDMGRTKQTLKLIEYGVKDAELLRGLGHELYQALFPNEINALFRATLAAQANNHNIRLRLIFQSPQLAALPWEFLYYQPTSLFLGNNIKTVLSRYIDVPLRKRDIIAASLPLKVLLVISSPTDLKKLDVDGEEQLIRSALQKRMDAGEIKLDVLKSATISKISESLQQKPYNVFHFIGHGEYRNNKGYIALVDTDGKANLLDDERFANFFLGNSNVALVVLNSCQGATVSSNQALAGTAPNLVNRGIPAVVAMQYLILDSTAKIFADYFYRTLALGGPVDEAIQRTRNAIYMEVGSDKYDFATPVLYMQSSDGIILQAPDGIILQASDGIILDDVIKKEVSQPQLPKVRESSLRNVSSDDDDLNSDKGVDYRRLQGLLKDGEWEQANHETVVVMLEAANRTEQGCLDDESINNFPRRDLRTINQLWVKYSNGRFGFSVQKRIWERVGGDLDATRNTWLEFCECVGWCVRRRWIVEYVINTSTCNGHLPIIGRRLSESWDLKWFAFRCLFLRADL